MSKKIEKDDLVKYLKTSVETAKQSDEGPKLNVENLKFYNSYSIWDKIFPFHFFLKTGEKIPKMEMDFLCTFRYLIYIRQEFINLLNTKFNKNMPEKEINILKKAEEKYFYANVVLYSSALFLVFYRPIRFKILNFYIGSSLLFASKYYSIYLIRKDFSDIKKRVLLNKTLLSDNDVYDFTLIPDWRTYLYYYKIL